VGRTAAGVHGQDRRGAAVQGVPVQGVPAAAREEQDPSAGQARGHRQHRPLCDLVQQRIWISTGRNAEARLVYVQKPGDVSPLHTTHFLFCMK
jgi:hypothetical protein